MYPYASKTEDANMSRCLIAGDIAPLHHHKGIKTMASAVVNKINLRSQNSSHDRRIIERAAAIATHYSMSY